MACWGFRCLGQAKRRGTPASCREGFGGGARGSLTSPSEAHRKSFLGQAAAEKKLSEPTWHAGAFVAWDRLREEASLPAAERGLGAGPVGL